MVNLRVVTENALGTEPGWIGSNQPMTLIGLNSAGQLVTLVMTVDSPIATITVGNISTTVDIATEVDRITGGIDNQVFNLRIQAHLQGITCGCACSLFDDFRKKMCTQS